MLQLLPDEPRGRIRLLVAPYLDGQALAELHVRVRHRDVLAVQPPTVLEHEVVQEEGSLHFAQLRAGAQPESAAEGRKLLA